MRRPNHRRIAAEDNIIDPATLPGFELRLDAAAITGKVHNDPTDWPDTSGNGRHALVNGVAPLPKYITVDTAPDGTTDLPAVHFNPFDGLGSELQGALPAGGIATTNGFTFYAMFRAFDAAAEQVVWQDSTGGRPQLRFGQELGWRDAGGTIDLAASTTGWQRLTWTFPPPSGTGIATLHRGGLLVGSNVWSFGAPATQYFMCVNQVGNLNLDAWFFEYLWFSQTHTALMRAGVEAFLTRKWGW